MRTVSLKLSDSQLRMLEHAASDSGRTKSELIRDALNRYLEPGENGTKGSVLDEIEDLIGCFDGPGDLSVNPKYMEDYGR